MFEFTEMQTQPTGAYVHPSPVIKSGSSPSNVQGGRNPQRSAPMVFDGRFTMKPQGSHRDRKYYGRSFPVPATLDFRLPRSALGGRHR